MGGVGGVGWVAHVIIVSAQSKELGFWVFYTWSDLRVRIWCLGPVGTGDWGLGLGLDNNSSVKTCTSGSNMDMCLTNGVTLHNVQKKEGEIYQDNNPLSG